jgi:hypothetical protein
MFFSQRKIPADQLARNYVLAVETFADELHEQITSGGRALNADQQREVCAAVWAAIRTTLDASALSDRETRKLEPLIFETMAPHWRKHCATDADIHGALHQRSSHYLRNRDLESQLKTASNIVNVLMDTVESDRSARSARERLLATHIAYRILEDLQDLNNIKTNHVID